MQTENDSDFPKLSAPAQRALSAAGIRRLDDLARVTKSELANWHGIGPTAVTTLARALDQRGLSFKP